MPRVSDQHLAARSSRRHTSREIDARTKVVAIPFDRRAVMEAHAHRGASVLAHRIVCDPKTEPDRLRRVGNAEHYGVTDRLYVLSPDLGQPRLHRTGEGADQLQRGLVTVSLRQRGEAGDVCKQEGRRGIGHAMYLPGMARAVHCQRAHRTM